MHVASEEQDKVKVWQFGVVSFPAIRCGCFRANRDTGMEVHTDVSPKPESDSMETLRRSTRDGSHVSPLSIKPKKDTTVCNWLLMNHCQTSSTNHISPFLKLTLAMIINHEPSWTIITNHHFYHYYPVLHHILHRFYRYWPLLFTMNHFQLLGMTSCAYRRPRQGCSERGGECKPGEAWSRTCTWRSCGSMRQRGVRQLGVTAVPQGEKRMSFMGFYGKIWCKLLQFIWWGMIIYDNMM